MVFVFTLRNINQIFLYDLNEMMSKWKSYSIL